MGDSLVYSSSPLFFSSSSAVCFFYMAKVECISASSASLIRAGFSEAPDSDPTYSQLELLLIESISARRTASLEDLNLLAPGATLPALEEKLKIEGLRDLTSSSERVFSSFRVASYFFEVDFVRLIVSSPV